MCVKVFAAEEVEWSRFGLTLDGEPITAILTHAELKSGMELEWLWDAHPGRYRVLLERRGGEGCASHSRV